jgi:2-keto-3-deoxy-L-rhamnonate aldolase RhmA
VWLEGEHGPVDFASVSDLAPACNVWGMTSIMRGNHSEQGVIYRGLDRSVQGSCVPHVNTRPETENDLDGGEFAPIGQRVLYESRQGYGVEDYLQVANDHTFLMILVEDII